MSEVRIQRGDIERIEAYFVNTASVPLTGLTPSLTIRRSDGLFWTGGQDFTSTFTQVAMSAVNAVSQGGYYERTFDTTGLPKANYYVIASGTGAGNSPALGEIKVGGFVDNLDASVQSMSNGRGGGVVKVDGLFNSKEKERLFGSIKDGFQEIFLKMDAILSKFDSLESKVDHLPEMKSKIELIKIELRREAANIVKHLEAQIDLIKSSEEIETLMGEANG